MKERKWEGISDMRDESDRQGMRVVLEQRANVQPRIVLNGLYKFAAMQKSFSANMLALGGRDAARNHAAAFHRFQARGDTASDGVRFEAGASAGADA